MQKTPARAANLNPPAEVAASIGYWYLVTPGQALPGPQGGSPVPCDAVCCDTDGTVITGIPGCKASGAIAGPPMDRRVRYADGWLSIDSITVNGGAPGSAKVWAGYFRDPTV